MRDGYDDSGAGICPDIEDEFLCEYVDGTMDPLVRGVFEEYVRANPGLREHIERLRHTRRLLCRYGCHCQAPQDLHHRIHRRITCDLLCAGIFFEGDVSPRLKPKVTVMSYLAATVLMLGLVVGVSGIDSDRGYARMASATLPVMQEFSGASPAARHLDRVSLMQPLPYTPRRHRVGSLHHDTGSLVVSGIGHTLRVRATHSGVMEAVLP